MHVSTSPRSLVLAGLVGLVVGAGAGYVWRGEAVAPAAPAKFSTATQAPVSDAPKTPTGAASDAGESRGEEASRTEVVDFGAAIGAALEDRDGLQSGI